MVWSIDAPIIPGGRYNIVGGLTAFLGGTCSDGRISGTYSDVVGREGLHMHFRGS